MSIVNNYITHRMLWILLSYLVSGGFAQASGLGYYSEPVSQVTQKNWSVAKPQVVFAFTYLDEQNVKKFETIVSRFPQYLREDQRSLKITTIPFARNVDLIQALQNPSTVGLVVVGHTYGTDKTGTIYPDATRFPIPEAITSAATPALRFLAFLGCNGPGVINHYQIEYDFARLPGHQEFYYSNEKFLSTVPKILGFIGLPSVQTRLKWIAEKVSLLDLTGGDEPITQSGNFSIDVKDVVAQYEPRIIYINGRIVGVLGANSENSNEDLEFKRLQYPVASWVFDSTKPQQSVRIHSTELTPGAPVDDYLVSQSQLTFPDGRQVTKTYDGALHFGIDQTPYAGAILAEPVFPKILKDYDEYKVPMLSELPMQYQSEAWMSGMDDIRNPFALSAWQKIRVRILQDYIQAVTLYARSHTYLDRSGDKVWSPLKARFFTEKY